jgi:thiol-disulfide isomerase/thioredoxin
MVSAYARPLHLQGYQRPDLRLADLRGDVVVLHLWATWCAPCKEELPSLVRFFGRDYPSLAARGLRVVTVSSDFAIGDLNSFMRRELASGLPDGFPVYWDPDSELNLHLGLGSALPQTVVLDRRGRRLRQVTGAVDWDSDRLLQQLESYL